ncbi:hypothetical protein ACHZ97_04140 [Lysobacter soli]|uniref:hypothetical protein n=1 Tax=Lysobacter soli TaxID=453783 RepID=UPI0037C5D219
MAAKRTPGQIHGSEPAFPSSRVEEHVSAKLAYNDGVTKREIYAALALQGLLAQTPTEISAAVAARQALVCADALCDALAKDGVP